MATINKNLCSVCGKGEDVKAIMSCTHMWYNIVCKDCLEAGYHPYCDLRVLVLEDKISDAKHINENLDVISKATNTQMADSFWKEVSLLKKAKEKK